MIQKKLGSGIAGFDILLKGIRPGDNIVWQVDSVDDYLPFVQPLASFARDNGFKPVYFRFSRHKPLLSPGSEVQIFELSPEEGFENFIRKFHSIINEIGEDGYYIFDCLSDLVVDWYSDRMLGNFFMLVCPYIRQAGAIAYFAMFRNRHSFHAMAPIIDHAPVFIDVFRRQEKLYIHPIKSPGRYSPTMNMLHVWEEGAFVPVKDSVTITEILSEVPWSRLDSASYRLGFWSSTFARAEDIQSSLDQGAPVKREARRLFKQLLRMAISRSDKVLELARNYFSLADILNIRKRMIGTGQIGGKSVGMLISRAILKQNDPHWQELLEPHDSFFIGSDVFYTFLVRNDIWWLYQKQGIQDHFLEDVEEGRKRMLHGQFPEYILKQFADMLDYFGQSPIIVRSSSLLEDNFGNAFAGKYESIFCANQGSRQQRLKSFLSALKKVYASTMSEEALLYRKQRGLLDRDEQMAILIQRVSGSPYGQYFYPQASGVGYSFNPYVWSEFIDAEAGMLRLVFGLGTRAVDRIEDDYVRIVALNAPERQLESSMGEMRQFAQQYVDVLDLDANSLFSISFEEAVEKAPDLPLEKFASQDRELARRRKAAGMPEEFNWVLTFENLLLKSPFAGNMRKMLNIIQAAYDCPVDLEFTVNFFNNGDYKINILQCRPLQLKGGGSIAARNPSPARTDVILNVQGPVIGPSRCINIDRVIYVDPEAYGDLSISDRHTVARLIGKITRLKNEKGHKTIMLIGPGRWGTTTPSLGLPISFAEINNASVICEIASMGKGVYPDISLGTHFFNDLIEMDILYLGILPNQENTYLNQHFFEDSPNKLGKDVFPEEYRWSKTIRVIDPPDFCPDKTLKLYANVLEQKFICYFQTGIK
jgi:hypothetical protein